MSVIVKGEITITKGFDHWKSMVFSQEEKMAEMDGKTSSQGFETIIGVEIALRMQWNASRIPKRQKNQKKFENQILHQ